MKNIKVKKKIVMVLFLKLTIIIKIIYLLELLKLIILTLFLKENIVIEIIV